MAKIPDLVEWSQFSQVQIFAVSWLKKWTLGIPSMIHFPPANPLCCLMVKELMDQKEKQDKTLRKLKKQLKVYVKRVEEFEGELPTDWSWMLFFLDDVTLQSELCVFSKRPAEEQSHLGESCESGEHRPQGEGLLRHAGVQGGGRGPPAQSFSHRFVEQVDWFLTVLLTHIQKFFSFLPLSDLKPRGVAVNFIPGLPAYIIFMCLRYADSVNSDQRVSSLLNSTISSIKGILKVE